MAPESSARDVTPSRTDRALTGTGVPAGWAFSEPTDDADLRAVLRTTVMEGAVSVAFTREPEHGAANGLAGAEDHTVLHRQNGCLDAMGRLSVQALYRNGVVRRMGYFADLRVPPGKPGGARRLREGFDVVCRKAEELGLEGCFTSVASDNDRARRVLERGRRIGLPEYVSVAELVTLLVPAGVRRRSRVDAEAAPDQKELTCFLDDRAREGQLSLTWDPSRWGALERHGLLPGHFRVVRKGGRIVAAGAVWDQRAFKQVLVCGYSGMLRWLRPLVNIGAALGMAPPLPAAGSILPQAAAVGAMVEDPAHWEALLPVLCQDARSHGLEWIVVAREARDPELGVLRRLVRGREYHTRLYEIRWPGMPSWPDGWDGRLFRPEVGLL